MSKWSDQDAAAYCKNYAGLGEDLALRVYTTRLLGRDHALVLHGGGNTSVKTFQADELGQQVEVLCVKGSGWDMGEIEPVGLPAVCLKPIQNFRQLNAMSDEAMVNGVRRHLLLSNAPTPSVETLLHAFIPEKFIDHTHADAILALADQPDAEALCRDLFQNSMGIVPYIMPGFALSKKAVEVYESNPDVEGLILINHGIFSFGSTAKEAYERMMRAVALAEGYLREKGRPSLVAMGGRKPAGRPFYQHSALIRGLLSRHEAGIGNLVCQHLLSPQIEAFLDRPDLVDLATRGTATPDHVIRTKQKPLVIEEPNLNDLDRFREQVATALDRYVADYRQYFQTQVSQKRVEKKPLHPLPLVVLVPGIGVLAFGKTVKDAGIVADIYEHTVDIILKAESIGRYRPLPDDHLFDMEYWSLEQAKLGKKAYRPLEGQISLITGAAGGIGRAVARVFAEAGSQLVLTDLEATPLESLASELSATYKIGAASMACNLTQEEDASQLIRFAGERFGGLDVLVSNAGRAFMGPIGEADDQLTESLRINLLAHQFLASRAAALMTLQGLGGCLLFNTSKSAFNPGSGFGAYGIAKAGLMALMKQYALEYADHGIRSMALNADRIRTPLFDADLIAARAKARGLEPDQYFRSNLLGAEVTAEDVARGFLHLCLSAKSTGTVLTVDGGNIAASPR